ncbi:hypothetical protein RY831_03765 [Noviherbaspirillum sp. CPCC 100848]|uniref:Transposase n=1 Tax=Noviherbaspirillum album TaxID=3080276 RepID=A0ABU6J484_9BURK|nr:hypothetical protein [Noviherbaspirillum sp. CPCC 100848]
MRIAMQASLGRVNNVTLFALRRARKAVQYFKDDPDRFVVCSAAVLSVAAYVVF